MRDETSRGQRRNAGRRRARSPGTPNTGGHRGAAAIRSGWAGIGKRGSKCRIASSRSCSPDRVSMNVPLPPTTLLPFFRVRRPQLPHGTIRRRTVARTGTGRRTTNRSIVSLCARGREGNAAKRSRRLSEGCRRRRQDGGRLQMLGRYAILIVVTAFLLCEITQARRARP